MKLRAQMLNHRLPLAPQPLTDHPAAVSFVWTLLKNLCRSCRGRKLPFAGYSVVKQRRSPPFGIDQQVSISRLAKPGGEYRARTGDLLVANQALSQLS